MTEFFTDSDYYTGPELTADLVRQAQEQLGVKLPGTYLELLRERNGGTPRRQCLPTPFPTSWALDHIEISAIRGIGGEWGIDSTSGLGSTDLIAEWGYPKIGVVLCDMPSGGHDAVMLDYSASGSDGEPAIAYIDEDRIPRRVADSFASFLTRLVPCDQFPTEPDEV